MVPSAYRLKSVPSVIVMLCSGELWFMEYMVFSSDLANVERSEMLSMKCKSLFLFLFRFRGDVSQLPHVV